jgi:Outer membrane lipoprotein-sorting protein
MNSSPAQILTGDFSLLQGQYFVEQLDSKKLNSDQRAKKAENYQMTSLKSGDSGFQKLSFSFDASGALVRLELIDKLDQITEISFSDLEVNQPMDSEIFNFIPPEGVDLISGN